MSNAVFPTFAGLTYDNVVAPQFNTKIHRAVSGYEVRAAYMAYPLWTFKLKYELLRDDVVYNELDTLLGFFNARQGSFDSFLYSNPADNAVVAQQFGIGNGAQTQFQLIRGMGGYVEPVQNLNGAPSLYVNGVLKNIKSSNLIFPSNSQLVFSSSGSVLSLMPTATPMSSSGALGMTISVANNTCAYAGSAINARAASNTKKFYARAGSLPYIWCGSAYATGNGVCFDLVNGVVAQTQGTATGTIRPTAIAGVFECTAFFQNADAGYSFVLSPKSLLNGMTGITAAGTVDVAFISLNDGFYSGEYVETTTSPIEIINYSVSQSGVVTFAAAPANAAALTWTGNYFYRCRFLSDSIDPTQFMANLYSLAKLEFIGSPMNKV